MQIAVIAKIKMQNRQQHWPEVCAFLQKMFHTLDWKFTLPNGSGNETYLVHGNSRTYFVKVGAHLEKYQVMVTADLTPTVLAVGHLEDGVSILVQAFVTGRKPRRKDFQAQVEQVAMIVHKTHHNLPLQQVLPAVSSALYQIAAFQTLMQMQQRWERYKAQVSSVADFVDKSFNVLSQQITGFTGAGLVASHNDICNANWIITGDDKLYLIDLESMSLEDPACDIGALLWWYYPPALRQRFLAIVGYANDSQFQVRMQVRMAMHCLGITLPRDNLTMSHWTNESQCAKNERMNLQPNNKMKSSVGA